MNILFKATALATGIALASAYSATAATITLAEFEPDASVFDFSTQVLGATDFTDGDLTISGGVISSLTEGPISGNSYYDGNNDNAVFEVSFANPVAAIGLDYYTNNLGGTLTAFDAVGNVLDTQTHDTSNPGGCSFPCGFIGLQVGSNSIARFTYDTGDNTNAWFLDNVIYQSSPVAPVPLPASALLLVGGLVGLRFMTKRKQ